MVNQNDMTSDRRCELLAPAGSLEKLKTAIHYGADAVYLGGKEFSLRARAANFTEEQMREGIRHAHARGVRVFVTVNIFAHDRDFTGLSSYLLHLAGIGADGIIVSDPGVLRLARRLVPSLSIHLSTQANVTNGESARFWEEQGVSRLNLARELSCAEIAAIRETTRAKIEVFVHGALCISYSGRCLLSCYLTGRDANRGDCAHPCRYSYRLEEEKRPGLYFPVEEDDRGTYIFNSKDLCLINRLPELLDAGVDSVKIEGRMKGIYYVAGIVRIYRAALDAIASGRAGGNGPGATVPADCLAEIGKLGSRGYTENFFDGPPAADDMLYGGARVDQTYVPAALVLDQGRPPLLEVRHRLLPGDRLEYMDRGLVNIPFEVAAITLPSGKVLDQANPGSKVHLDTVPAIDWQPYGLVRKVQMGANGLSAR